MTALDALATSGMARDHGEVSEGRFELQFLSYPPAKINYMVVTNASKAARTSGCRLTFDERHRRRTADNEAVWSSLHAGGARTLFGQTSLFSGSRWRDLFGSGSGLWRWRTTRDLRLRGRRKDRKPCGVRSRPRCRRFRGGEGQPDLLKPNDHPLGAQPNFDVVISNPPNGAYCVFKTPVEGSRQGRLVLVEHRDIVDPELAGPFTVKIWESDKEPTDEGSWMHTEIRLKPDSLDPGFETIVLREIPEDEIQVVAELAEVLQAPTGALAATRNA